MINRERPGEIAHLRGEVDEELLHILGLDLEVVSAEILGDDARAVVPPPSDRRIGLTREIVIRLGDWRPVQLDAIDFDLAGRPFRKF